MKIFNMEKFITQIKLYLRSVLLSSFIVIAINTSFINSLFQTVYVALLIILFFLFNLFKPCLFMVTNNFVLYSWVSIVSLFFLTINYVRPQIGLLSSESFTLILPIFVLFSWVFLYDLVKKKLLSI